jgi:hypothetical protein
MGSTVQLQRHGVRPGQALTVDRLDAQSGGLGARLGAGPAWAWTPARWVGRSHGAARWNRGNGTGQLGLGRVQRPRSRGGALGYGGVGVGCASALGRGARDGPPGRGRRHDLGWAARLSKVGLPGRGRRDGPFPFLSYFLYLLFFSISFSSLYLKLGLVLIQIQPRSTILDRCTSKQKIIQK